MSGPLVQPEETRAWPLYRALVGVGLICGLLVVGVFVGTRPVIERKRAEALEHAIFQVLPEARSSRSFRLEQGERFVAASGKGTGKAPVHAGYDAEGRLVGFAIEAEGMGYQDVIALIYGYSVDADAITGLRVLESRETPGLGNKIESDPGFLANFDHLDVALAPDATRIAHPIEAVKHGHKEHPWQVDGITGATISSQAVAAILRTSTSHWIPLIRRHLDDFVGAKP